MLWSFTLPFKHQGCARHCAQCCKRYRRVNGIRAPSCCSQDSLSFTGSGAPRDWAVQTASQPHLPKPPVLFARVIATCPILLTQMMTSSHPCKAGLSALTWLPQPSAPHLWGHFFSPRVFTPLLVHATVRVLVPQSERPEYLMYRRH